ncbi:MAG: polyprenyl glycosylphosphotransferase [Deltaproteobacteria bacterium RBG_16_50_11]|nr:MAG: polyprenyl glycosylphosphotransferase [Deltaproteobacteria bacterium RBG_16_50_11]
MGNQVLLGRKILSKPHFISSLRLEKRRADRSKIPLSLVLFYVGREENGELNLIQRLLISLVQKTRETDIKGWIDHDVIGLLLPGTDEKGTQTCVEKISSEKGERPYSIVTATYPDHLFQRLLCENEDSSDFFPLSLDEPEETHAIQFALKRVIDVAGSVVGIFLSSPLILLTAFTIKITSPGPVLFKQIRLGKRGARFSFYKFRSMVVGGDDQIHRDYVTNLIKGNLDKVNQGNEQKPFYKIKCDPRVTPVGRIIRKLSIDEIPQFFNVIKGEMSLVGPRPPLPYEIEEYDSWHLRRILEVKPGITGLWQVDGRSQTSFDDMVRLDLRYVQNWSLWLDLKILIKTLGAVVRSNGAV